MRHSAESEYRCWFDRARLEVERVDGQPVGTCMALPIDLKILRHVQSPPLRHDDGAAGEG